MSEQTNTKLIAEAREHWPALFRAPGARELIDRLADALEAADARNAALEEKSKQSAFEVLRVIDDLLESGAERE